MPTKSNENPEVENPGLKYSQDASAGESVETGTSLGYVPPTEARPIIDGVRQARPGGGYDL